MVARLCRRNDSSVIDSMRRGQLDAVFSSNSGLVDEILLAMSSRGILDCIESGFVDRRKANTTVPFKSIMASAIAAKMNVNQSLTDAAFAIKDHRLLAELGCNLVDANGRLSEGLFKEGTVRHLIGKYDSTDLVHGYNDTVQEFILPKLGASPNIHILDCTKIGVNIKNRNFEGSGIARDNDNNPLRGYKMATIRGIVGDAGVIEEICLGSAEIHDKKLSLPMLYSTTALKPGDMLLCDRGFLARPLINYLKYYRGVDIIIPLKQNMDAFKMAVSTAKMEGRWEDHPNKKRTNQKIAIVPNLGEHYAVKGKGGDIDLNACVVWDTTATKGEEKYRVFITTDLTMSAKTIVKTYELRTEIEEDFRQLKDFWEIEKFKSTKLNAITFHIVCTLLGYLFWQIYKTLPEGVEYERKSLPCVLKSYASKNLGHIVCFVGDEFGILSIIEFGFLFESFSDDVKLRFIDFMG